MMADLWLASVGRAEAKKIIDQTPIHWKRIIDNDKFKFVSLSMELMNLI